MISGMSSDGVNRRLQINAEQVRGGFARVTVLVEFDAGHHEHFVTPPRALAFALDDGENIRHLFLAERADWPVRIAFQQPLRVGQMVGDADAIETALAVKINDLRHAQFAVGIIRVDVKIAEQHLRVAAVSIFPATAGRMTRGGAVSNSFTALRPGLSCRIRPGSVPRCSTRRRGG
jgi:hypothetical protein